MILSFIDNEWQIIIAADPPKSLFSPLKSCWCLDLNGATFNEVKEIVDKFLRLEPNQINKYFKSWKRKKQ